MRPIVLNVVMAVLVAACRRVDSTSSIEEAKEVFRARCAVCHGSSGKGDGPGAFALDPKPRDYTDVAWQNSVSDEHVRRAIASGGLAVNKSPFMPSNPDLRDRPELLSSLVGIVRGFGGR